MFLKNRNIISKVKISKVTDYAALIENWAGFVNCIRLVIENWAGFVNCIRLVIENWAGFVNCIRLVIEN